MVSGPIDTPSITLDIGRESENSLVLKETPSFSMRIFEAVRPAIKETACAIVLNASVMPFFATPVSIPLFTLSVGTAFVGSCLFAAWDARHNNEPAQRTTDCIKTTSLLSRCTIVNTLGLSYPNFLIHEGGHFLAAKALFKKANPTLWISPFRGGSTIYTASLRFTWIGSFFSKTTCKLMIAASGLLSSGVYACAALIGAERIEKQYPIAAQYIRLHAFTLLFQEVMYGLTAFLASKHELRHDLVHLWRVGRIHPLIPITLLIAIPLMILSRQHQQRAA